jgi:prepilin signal peptidase PulO-like enzyme (type II secretory pathway)
MRIAGAEQTLNNAIYRYGGIAMHCPKCKNPISPLKVWLITRWSPLRCVHCGIFLFIQTPLVLITWIIVVMLIDAYTVQLVLDQERPQ